MSIIGPIIALPDGSYARKPWADLKPDDSIVFGGGPDASADLDKIQRELEAEIAAAGGLAAWRAIKPALAKQAA